MLAQKSDIFLEIVIFFGGYFFLDRKVNITGITTLLYLLRSQNK